MNEVKNGNQAEKTKPIKKRKQKEREKDERRTK